MKVGQGRPVIGITTDFDMEKGAYSSYVTYAKAVEKGGGLPLLLPYKSDLTLILQYVDLIDGMLFSGGDDLDPTLFGQERHSAACAIDPERQAFEMALMAEVERRRTPTLGICLGSQLMNVYRGGSLNQFLPEMAREPMIEHRKIGTVSPRHDVELSPQSLVADALGKTRLNVNSSHKQSVRETGRGLRVIGKSPDGVIEGVEDPSLPLFLGVQWHPERLHEEADHLALFQLLVEKARPKNEG